MRTAAAAVILAAVLTAGVYFARQSGTDPERYGNDFSVYFLAARELLSGSDPYQRTLSLWTPYLYPPLLAELMLPLGLLPLPIAAYLWFLLSAAATIGLARISAACADLDNPETLKAAAHGSRGWWLAGAGKGAWLIAGLAAVICGRFLLDNFKLGQVNTIVASLAAAHVFLYASGRRRLSAVALALAAAIKLTPALLLGYHLAKRRWGFAFGTAALMVVIGGASFLPFGSRAPQVFVQFFDRTVRNQQGFDLAYAGNQSLRGFVGRISGEGKNDVTPPAGGPAQRDEARQPVNRWALGLAILVLVGAGAAAAKAHTELAAAAPFFCCLVLLSPLSWKVHFVIMVLPVAFLVACAQRSPPSPQKAALGAILVAVFALFDLTSRNVFGLAFAEWADAHSLVLGGGLMVYGSVIWQAGRQFVNLKPAAVFGDHYK